METSTPPPSESNEVPLSAGKASASTGFSQPELERRLSQLKESAESIQSLSSWCLRFPHQHKRIVSSWLKVLKRAKNPQRLPLFYLANDVIQHGKRKQMNFVDSFGNVLESAMPLVRDEKLRPAINRILKIWQERSVFSETYIESLTAVIENVVKADSEENAKIISDFRLEELLSQVRQVEQSEKLTDSELRQVNLCQFHATSTNIEDVRANVKSRAQSRVFVHELEQCVEAVQSYVAALDCEIRLRGEFIEQLERAEIYYETQRNDAKVVSMAYKNFGRRLRDLKKRLEEALPNLAVLSPVPSPDIDAPSPTGSDDLLDLPDEELTSCQDTGDQITTSDPQEESHEQNAGLDPRTEIERILGKWTSHGDTHDSLSGTERRLSEDDCRRVPASDAANGSDGRGDRISSVGSSNSAPGRRTASCDERLAELFPAMFATSDDQEADAASSHHSEEPLFPVNTKITDPSVLAAKLFGSPSSHQRCNTEMSNGYSTPTTGESEYPELSKSCDDDQVDEEDYDDDEDHLVSSLVRRVDARLQKQQYNHSAAGSSNGALWTERITQEAAGGSGVVDCFQHAAIPGLDFPRAQRKLSPLSSSCPDVCVSPRSTVSQQDSPESSPSVTPPLRFPVTSLFSNPVVPVSCPPATNSPCPATPSPCPPVTPLPCPPVTPLPCPPVTLSPCPVPPPSCPSVAPLPCPPVAPLPCPPVAPACFLPVAAVTLPPAFAAPPIVDDSTVFRPNEAATRRQWDQSVDEFIQRLQRGGGNEASGAAGDVDLRSGNQSRAAVDTAHCLTSPAASGDERVRNLDRSLSGSSRLPDATVDNESATTESHSAAGQKAYTGDEDVQIKVSPIAPSSSEEAVQYIGSLGVFRRIKQEPVDAVCEAIPLPGEAAITTVLGPLPPPLRVRTFSPDRENGAAADSDEPRMIWFGQPHKSAPPLVDIVDLPSASHDMDHLRSSQHRRERSSSDSDRHSRRRRRRSVDRHRTRSRQRRARRHDSSASSSDRRHSRRHGERHAKRHRRHRRHHSSGSDSEADRRKRRHRKRKHSSSTTNRRFDYSQVGAGAKRSSDDHSSRRRR